MLFNSKTISGFALYSFLTTLTEEERKTITQRVSDDLRDGGKIFGSTIVKEISLENWQEGLTDSSSVSSEGKILINCQWFNLQSS